jgi:predicted GH43/DUF377 family glycosyl hydrolase
VTLAHHLDAGLGADPSRVIARLFLPGEELQVGRSRAATVVSRVLALAEDDVERVAMQLKQRFDARHVDLVALLADHAATVSSHAGMAAGMSAARRLVMGASFTAEYAVEGAALCNPSAVLHPDQSGLGAGQVRVAVSLRGIGEGHLSSIGFASALVGPGPSWVFEPRAHPVVAGTTSTGRWRREHLRAVLIDQGRVDGLAHNVLAALPPDFTGYDLADALADANQDLLSLSGGSATVDLLRQLVASAYDSTFPADVALSQRVLMPSAAEESNGMEDARFVRFVEPDGTVEYRATYTAYDGHRIAPRLLTSPDLRSFSARRLAGPAAHNKGMALFPRLIDGRHWALCRTDGESTSVATSPDGFVWGAPQLVASPTQSWEIMQVGNCGPPIETDRGWLVLTHGVGPMRVYAMGAFLLDLDDPRRVLARLDRPLLEAFPDERDGYVPNVVYSCGGLIHDGRLWLPYGIGDARIAVMWADVHDLLATMRTTQAPTIVR